MSPTSSFVLFHLTIIVCCVSMAHADPVEVPKGEMSREVRARFHPYGQLVYFTLNKLDKCKVDQVARLTFHDKIRYTIELLHKYKVMSKPAPSDNGDDELVHKLEQMSERDFSHEYGLEFQFELPNYATIRNLHINDWFEQHCDNKNMEYQLRCKNLQKMLDSGDGALSQGFEPMISSSFWCKFKFETTRSYVQKSMAQVRAQISKSTRSKVHFIKEFFNALVQESSGLTNEKETFLIFLVHIFGQSFVRANFVPNVQYMERLFGFRSIHGLLDIPQELELCMAEEWWRDIRFFRDVNSDDGDQLTVKFKVDLDNILKYEFFSLFVEAKHADAYKLKLLRLKMRVLFLVIKDALRLVVEQSGDEKIVDNEDDNRQKTGSGNDLNKLEVQNGAQDQDGAKGQNGPQDQNGSQDQNGPQDQNGSQDQNGPQDQNRPQDQNGPQGQNGSQDQNESQDQNGPPDQNGPQDLNPTLPIITNGKPYPLWVKVTGAVTIGAVLVAIACSIFGCASGNSQTVSSMSLPNGSFISTTTLDGTSSDGHNASTNLSLIVSTALLVSLVIMALVVIWYYRKNRSIQRKSPSVSPTTST